MANKSYLDELKEQMSKDIKPKKEATTKKETVAEPIQTEKPISLGLGSKEEAPKPLGVVVEEKPAVVSAR